MLYHLTLSHHQPFIFTSSAFNSFSQSPLSKPLLSSSTVQEMECLQGAALRNGFGAETVPFAADDFSAVVHGGGGGANAVNGDDLFVDELLDFSSSDVVSEAEEPLFEPEGRETHEINKGCSVSVEKQSMSVNGGGLTARDHFGSLPERESTETLEGLESLEWLSHFVEESFSEYPLAGKLPHNPFQNPSVQTAPPCFAAATVLTKARTKRARSGVRVWPVLSSSATTPLADSSSTISSTSSSSNSSATTTSFPFPAEPAKKLQKKKPGAATSHHQQPPQQPRKCSHCGVTKTPQWRAGPLGPKTLCNACGVRFKSGRLLPEYRPACSPTFSGELHSNNHRKVLEMRKKKESENGPAGSAPPAAAHNF